MEKTKRFRNLGTALVFLSPNLLGLLMFTLFPLGFSMAMAFTDWDIRRQNMFKPNPIHFIGLANFIELFKQPEFWRFFGNTLFLMMGIPAAIGGSLLLAILLTKESPRMSRKTWLALFCTVAALLSTGLLATLGLGASAMDILIGSAGGGILLLGLAGGRTVYRTLLYLPSFTSGVAIFILWKDIYNPDTGPLNLALAPVLASLQAVVRSVPASWIEFGIWISVIVMCALLTLMVRHLSRMWHEGDLGTAAFLLSLGMLLAPAITGWFWLPEKSAAITLLLFNALVALWPWTPLAGAREAAVRWDEGLGSGLMLAFLVAALLFVVEGLGLVCFHLPGMAAKSLTPPQWLASYYWAKPGLMIMGFWIAVGSNNMLLYLAGLSNVPPELYEAADLDGASPLAKFWHVTWPMLAPTTFFICIMSIIGGLQGGWEMAVAMTKGGPAGSTTTLSYQIYSAGFQSGRFGYASAVAWVMFILVFLATLVSWKLGSRYVNE